jgi:hypothetical protein
MRIFPVAAVTAIVLALALPAAGGLFGSSWAEERDKANRCYELVDRDPEFRSLYVKLAIDSPTLDQLADMTLPTESEAMLIRGLAGKRVPCREGMLAALREHHPFLVSSYEIRNFQWDIVYAQLMNRRITFGNANRLIHQSELEFRKRQEKYNQARSDEQRRALADSMRDLSRQAQSSPPPSGSGRMTCRWIGPTLYCDPY